MSDDKADPLDPEHPPGDVDADATRRSRLMSALTKRLQNPRQLSGDAMELLGVVLENSDRAKTEMVKMVAREVRHYLEELKLREDIRALVTSHSLEVQMSLKLKPLDDAPAAPSAPPAKAQATSRKEEGAPPASASASKPASAEASSDAPTDAS